MHRERLDLTRPGRDHLAPRRPNGHERESPHNFRKIEIDDSLFLSLRREAARRECTVPRLVADLLDRIVTDNLAKAVLDD